MFELNEKFLKSRDEAWRILSDEQLEKFRAFYRTEAGALARLDKFSDRAGSSIPARVEIIEDMKEILLSEGKNVYEVPDRLVLVRGQIPGLEAGTQLAAFVPLNCLIPR